MQVHPIVEGNEVRIDQLLPDTTAGRDAAEEIRGGLFKGLSVEFRALRQTVFGGVRRIFQARLLAAGLVDSPSYATATARAEAARDRAERDRWEIVL